MDDRIKRIVKPALIESGFKNSEFMPLHIWKYFFAQDGLHATNWNYE